MPFPAVGDAGAPPSLFGGADYGLAVNSTSDAAEAAETMVAFFALDPAGAGLVAQSGFPSALNGVPLVISDLVDEAAQSAALEAMSADIAAMTTPREIPYPELRDTLGDALASVAAGTMTPEEAAAALQGVSASVERP
jgi:ABC-type glycerol-3-phosphate transport system substrate-binding protein